MKNRQIIALVSSIFFFNLLVFSLPARGRIEKKFSKYGVIITNTETSRTMFEAQKCLSKNLKTIEIDEGPTSDLYCIISRTFNKHGIIYKVDTKTGVLTLYVGNNFDAIIDYPNGKRIHGYIDPDEFTNKKYMFFTIMVKGSERSFGVIIPKY
jgi:hypothetical protein